MVSRLRCLLKSSSHTRIHFYLLACLAFIYVLQVSLFLLSIKELGDAPFSTIKKWEVALLGYLFAFALLYGLLQFASLMVWKIAQLFSGAGGLNETRVVLSWWLFCLSPMGFLFLLFQYTHNHPEAAGVRILDALGLIGIPTLVLFGGGVLVKGLAEVHQFSLLRALAVSLLIALMFLLGIYALT